MTSVLPFYLQHSLNRNDSWIVRFTITGTIAMLATVPVWVALSQRFPKRTLVLIAMLVYGAVGLSWLRVGGSSTGASLIVRIALGSCMLSGITVLLQAMFVEAVAHDHLLCGQRREGVLNGLFTLVDKISAAIGIALVGVLLSAGGYVAHAHGAVSPGAVRTISLIWALFPAISYSIAFSLIWFYRPSVEAQGAGSQAAVPRVDTVDAEAPVLGS